MKSIMAEYSSHESPYRPNVNSMEWEKFVKQQGDEYSLDLVDTLRSLRENIRILKANNNRLIEAHEILARAHRKQVEVNAVILQSLSDLQK